MIGLDTNVIVRYVMQDDPVQSAQATALIESLDREHPGYVSLVALAELHCVLRRAYRVTPEQVARVVLGLLDSAEIRVAEPDSVRRALLAAGEGADFADALVAELGAAAGCGWTATFDERAARATGVRLVPVDG